MSNQSSDARRAGRNCRKRLGSLQWFARRCDWSADEASLVRLQKENGLEQTATLDAHTIVTMFGNIGPSQGSSMPPMPIRALVNDEFRNQASSARTVRATTPHKIAAALFAAAYAARNGCAVREVWHPCAAVTAWVALTGHRSVTA